MLYVKHQPRFRTDISFRYSIPAVDNRFSSQYISIIVTTTIFADFWPNQPEVHELSAPKTLLKGVLGAAVQMVIIEPRGRTLVGVTISWEFHIINNASPTHRQILAADALKYAVASKIDVLLRPKGSGGHAIGA